MIWEANASYTVLADGGLAAVNSAGTLAGRIVVMGCNQPLMSRLTSAVIAPPYTSLDYLSGLGDVSDGGTVWRMPPGGAYIYGYASTKGTNTAVRWRRPF